MKKVFMNSPQTPPTGTHAARIVTVADLGDQREHWEGEDRKKWKIGISYELPNKQGHNGLPVVVSERVTGSLNEKSRLYQIAKAALSHVPYELDPVDLLGKEVMVTLGHRETNKGTYATVEAVTSVPEGMTVPTTQTPLRVYDVEQPDPVIFAQLPPLFQKLINERVQPSNTPSLPSGSGDPFAMSDAIDLRNPFAMLQ